MLTKANLDIAKLAAKDESRYSLQSIRVTPEYTEATDGYCLARISNEKVKAEDFPSVEGASRPAGDFQPFLLDAQSALAISKAIPKGRTDAILKHAAIGKASDENGHAEILVTDLERPQVFRPAKKNGTYPDLDRVLDSKPREGKRSVTVGVSAKRLRELLAVIEKVSDDRSHAVKMTVSEDEDQGIRFECSNGEQEAVAILMPMRV